MNPGYWKRRTDMHLKKKKKRIICATFYCFSIAKRMRRKQTKEKHDKAPRATHIDIIFIISPDSWEFGGAGVMLPLQNSTNMWKKEPDTRRLMYARMDAGLGDEVANKKM